MYKILPEILNNISCFLGPYSLLNFSLVSKEHSFLRLSIDIKKEFYRKKLVREGFIKKNKHIDDISLCTFEIFLCGNGSGKNMPPSFNIDTNMALYYSIPLLREIGKLGNRDDIEFILDKILIRELEMYRLEVFKGLCIGFHMDIIDAYPEIFNYLNEIVTSPDIYVNDNVISFYEWIREKRIIIKKISGKNIEKALNNITKECSVSTLEWFINYVGDGISKYSSKLCNMAIMNHNYYSLIYLLSKNYQIDIKNIARDASIGGNFCIIDYLVMHGYIKYENLLVFFEEPDLNPDYFVQSDAYMNYLSHKVFPLNSHYYLFMSQRELLKGNLQIYREYLNTWIKSPGIYSSDIYLIYDVAAMKPDIGMEIINELILMNLEPTKYDGLLQYSILYKNNAVLEFLMRNWYDKISGYLSKHHYQVCTEIFSVGDIRTGEIFKDYFRRLGVSKMQYHISTSASNGKISFIKWFLNLMDINSISYGFTLRDAMCKNQVAMAKYLMQNGDELSIEYMKVVLKTLYIKQNLNMLKILIDTLNLFMIREIMIYFLSSKFPPRFHPFIKYLRDKINALEKEDSNPENKN